MSSPLGGGCILEVDGALQRLRGGLFVAAQRRRRALRLGEHGCSRLLARGLFYGWRSLDHFAASTAWEAARARGRSRVIQTYYRTSPVACAPRLRWALLAQKCEICGWAGQGPARNQTCKGRHEPLLITTPRHVASSLGGSLLWQAFCRQCKPPLSSICSAQSTAGSSHSTRTHLLITHYRIARAQSLPRPIWVVAACSPA